MCGGIEGGKDVRVCMGKGTKIDKGSVRMGWGCSLYSRLGNNTTNLSHLSLACLACETIHIYFLTDLLIFPAVPRLRFYCDSPIAVLVSPSHQTTLTTVTVISMTTKREF